MLQRNRQCAVVEDVSGSVDQREQEGGVAEHAVDVDASVHRDDAAEEQALYRRQQGAHHRHQNQRTVEVQARPRAAGDLHVEIGAGSPIRLEGVVEQVAVEAEIGEQEQLTIDGRRTDDEQRPKHRRQLSPRPRPLFARAEPGGDALDYVDAHRREASQQGAKVAGVDAAVVIAGALAQQRAQERTAVAHSHPNLVGPQRRAHHRLQIGAAQDAIAILIVDAKREVDI